MTVGRVRGVCRSGMLRLSTIALATDSEDVGGWEVEGIPVTSPTNPQRTLLIVVIVLGLTVVGCVRQETDGPGPVGEVGPQTPVGPVGEEEGISGSGNITTETVNVGSFDRLVFRSEGSVLLAQSDNPGLSVTADENLHQYIEVVAEDSTLTISTVAGTDVAPSSEMVFRVEASDLSAVELSGVGTLTADGIDGNSMSIVLSGTGDITIDDLRVERVSIVHSGVGTIRLAGEVDDQQVSVSGVGEYDGADLLSRVAVIEASKMGEATVWVTDDLTCVVAESGLIEFYGTPAVDQRLSGSGSTAALGDK